MKNLKNFICIILIVISFTSELFALNSYTIIDSNNISLLAKQIALQEVGIKEIGNNRGARIDLYNKTAGVALGSPYCASGIYYCFYTASTTLNKKNIIKRTASANGQYDYLAKKGIKDKKYNVKNTSLIIWKYPNSYYGHIEKTYKVLSNGNIQTIGFNTTPGNVGNQRNGGGVYIRMRNVKHKLGRMSVRGIINFETKTNIE